MPNKPLSTLDFLQIGPLDCLIHGSITIHFMTTMLGTFFYNGGVSSRNKPSNWNWYISHPKVITCVLFDIYSIQATCLLFGISSDQLIGFVSFSSIKYCGKKCVMGVLNKIINFQTKFKLCQLEKIVLKYQQINGQ